MLIKTIPVKNSIRAKKTQKKLMFMKILLLVNYLHFNLFLHILYSSIQLHQISNRHAGNI